MTRGAGGRRMAAVGLGSIGALVLGGCTGNAANSQGMAARPYLEAHRPTRTVDLLLLADTPVGRAGSTSTVPRPGG